MQIIKLRKYDVEAVLKFIILLGFSAFFLITLLTGKAQLYVHPRIIPFIMFAIVAMIVISGFTFFDIFKPHGNRVNLVPYLFFIVPLFVAFSLPAKSMDSSSLPVGDIKVGQQSVSTSKNVSGAKLPDNSGFTNNNTNNNLASPSNNAGSNSDSSLLGGKDSKNPTADLILQGDTIVIDDSNFVKLTMDIFTNTDKYIGKRIQVIGFVYKDPRLKDNEFVPARFMMACCTADMQPVGLLCQYPRASQLKKDSWVKVTGTINETEFEGQKIPLFQADNVVSADKPKNDYVYPY